jgi:hypothetical protein
VKKNTISNSTGYGIYLLANDTDITDGNKIRDNGNYGIKAYNSSRNNIHCNNFYNNNNSDNDGGEHQAWDNKDSNDWDNNDATGNYWDGWDLEEHEGESYSIDGAGYQVDEHPSASPF